MRSGPIAIAAVGASAPNNTSEPNKKIRGRMFAVGGGRRAAFCADGVARIVIDHHR